MKEMKEIVRLVRSYDMMDSSSPMSQGPRKTDYSLSKKLLLDIMMKKYHIDDDDLHDVSVVKSKLRDINIEEILK